ncbi:MAG: CoA-binding protein [Nanobdellota archaeon]
MTSLDTSKTYAIVGASADTSKYGYTIFSDLRSKQCTVIPVNPKGGVLDGVPVSRSLLDVSKHIDVVVMVTPPHITEHVIEDVLEKSIPLIWFQPGSFNTAILDWCKKKGIDVVPGACIMT